MANAVVYEVTTMVNHTMSLVLLSLLIMFFTNYFGNSSSSANTTQRYFKIINQPTSKIYMDAEKIIVAVKYISSKPS